VERPGSIYPWKEYNTLHNYPPRAKNLTFHGVLKAWSVEKEGRGGEGFALELGWNGNANLPIPKSLPGPSACSLATTPFHR